MAEVFTRSIVVKKDVKQELSDFSLGPGTSKDIDIRVPVGRAGVAAILRVTYDTAATKGVKIYFFYSPDGTNWDTDTDDVFDHPFGAGVAKQKTYISASLPLHVRIRIENLDTTYSATISLWRVFV